MMKILLQLIKKLLGASKKRAGKLHHELDHLAGSWTEVEAREFDKNLAAQRKIDPALRR